MEDYDESHKKQANLPFKLSENEVLVAEVKRSKIPFAAALIFGFGLGSFFMISAIQLYGQKGSWIEDLLGSGVNEEFLSGLVPVFIAVSVLTTFFGAIWAYVYSLNRMFITNEHIVRIVYHNPFSRDTKVISHLNIEDVKEEQRFLGMLLGYGALTLSTEGQNATYHINYVKNASEYAVLATDTRDKYEKNLVDGGGGGTIPGVEKR